MTVTRSRVKGSKKNGITVSKGNCKIKFDIQVETPKGVLWCAFIKRHDPAYEVATEANDVVSTNPPVRDEKEIKSILKLNIVQAHAILGHSNENTTRKTAGALDIAVSPLINLETQHDGRSARVG